MLYLLKKICSTQTKKQSKRSFLKFLSNQNFYNPIDLDLILMCIFPTVFWSVFMNLVKLKILIYQAMMAL